MGIVPRTTYICINRLATSISDLYKREPVHTINLIRNITIKDGKCEAIGHSCTKVPSCEIYLIVYFSCKRVLKVGICFLSFRNYSEKPCIHKLSC